jgi:hypothetical protein
MTYAASRLGDFMKALFAAAAALSLGACATITRGTTEHVSFYSDPPGARVRTSLGHVCPTTPCTLEISRKSEFMAVFSLPGYHDTQVPVQTRVGAGGAAGLAGNVFIGGLGGIIADASTGATLEHFPNPVVGVMSRARAPRGPVRRGAPTS